MEKVSADMDSSASGYYYQKTNGSPAQVVYLPSHGNLGGDTIGLNSNKYLSPYKSLPYTTGGDNSAHGYVISHLGGEDVGTYDAGAYGAGLHTATFYPVPNPPAPRSAYGGDGSYGVVQHFTKPASYELISDKTIIPQTFKVVERPVPLKLGPQKFAALKLVPKTSSSEEQSGSASNESGSASNESGSASHEDYSKEKENLSAEKGFVAKKGSSAGTEYHHKHGNVGNKKYDNEHKFSKGEKGDYSKEHHEGEYDEDAGKKKSHLDEANHYESHHEAEKGSKGGKFGEKKHHKKGSKTTGYHNVFHKDEYKKDHTFYDDADHKGHFEKHGSDKKYHKGESGKGLKGGHHDSAYKEGHKDKNGNYKKGHHDHEDEGYNNKKGHDDFHDHNSDYGKQGVDDGHTKHGYAKAHHHHG